MEKVKLIRTLTQCLDAHALKIVATVKEKTEMKF